MFQKYPKWKAEGVRLVLMGSCRDGVDEARIEGLRELSRTLEIEVNWNSLSGKLSWTKLTLA